MNFGFEPLPAQTIVDGAIMNQGAVVDAIRTLRDNLGIKGREVATAISGHSVIIKKIKVPPMTPEELEEQIPWEAEHHIPFSKDDVEIDHQLIGNEGGGGQMELLLVAAKKEVVADYSMVIREAKLVPMIMDVAAFTIQNAFEANYPVVPEEAIAIINVGATLSNINIIAGGSSAFTRDVTVGGNAFTEEIQKRLNVSQEEAEAWKIGSAGESVSEVVPRKSRPSSPRSPTGWPASSSGRSTSIWLPAATRLSRRSTCAGDRPRCRPCRKHWKSSRELRSR